MDVLCGVWFGMLGFKEGGSLEVVSLFVWVAMDLGLLVIVERRKGGIFGFVLEVEFIKGGCWFFVGRRVDCGFLLRWVGGEGRVWWCRVMGYSGYGEFRLGYIELEFKRRCGW